MKEDIKRLEKLIEKCKECTLHECINCEISYSDVKAIENLIARYKELEEFKKQVEEIESTNFIKYKNYIPKSKIRKYIDKTQKELDKYKVKGMYIAIEGQTTQDDINTWIIQRATLQELLEE